MLDSLTPTSSVSGSTWTIKVIYPIHVSGRVHEHGLSSYP